MPAPPLLWLSCTGESPADDDSQLVVFRRVVLLRPCKELGARGEVTHTDARLWHPWFRINRVLRAMLTTRWSAEAWPQVKTEFTKALALKSQFGARGGSTDAD